MTTKMMPMMVPGSDASPPLTGFVAWFLSTMVAIAVDSLHSRPERWMNR